MVKTLEQQQIAVADGIVNEGLYPNLNKSSKVLLQEIFDLGRGIVAYEKNRKAFELSVLLDVSKSFLYGEHIVDKVRVVFAREPGDARLQEFPATTV